MQTAPFRTGRVQIMFGLIISVNTTENKGVVQLDTPTGPRNFTFYFGEGEVKGTQVTRRARFEYSLKKRALFYSGRIPRGFMGAPAPEGGV
jgi:hypothetical protein